MARRGQASDAELVRAARQRDADAYRELVVRYQGHVYGLAYSLVGDWSEAQDIAQETFVRVHLNLDRLRDPERFAPWLRRVTFSVTMNWLRAFRRSTFERLDGRVDLERLEIPDFRPGPSEVVERRELADAVLRAVESLPPRYRLPLTMFHLDGLSYRKVADFLDIPLGTAKSLIKRARERLKPILAAALSEEVTPMVSESFDEHRLPEDFARSVIHGIEGVRWGAGEKENSTMGALAAALTALGGETSYEYLMGASGAAFRLQMHQPEWCPSAPHARCGFDCLRPAFDATRYELVDMPVQPGDEEGRERVRQAVIESIDRGHPVFFSSLEESLIVGYRDEGRRLLMRLYGADHEGYVPWALLPDSEDPDTYPRSFVFEWPHLSFGFLRERASAPDRRQVVLRSLRLAQELAYADAFEHYASGFAAYGFWIETLRDESRFEDAERRETAMNANAHCYYSLFDARSAAAVYLRDVAKGFEAPVAEPLARAAELYARVAGVLERPRCVTEIAPMRWKIGEQGHWTREQRREQAALLEEARSVEERAVRELEAALAAA